MWQRQTSGGCHVCCQLFLPGEVTSACVLGQTTEYCTGFFFFFYFIRIFMALISCLRFRLVGTVLTSFDLLRNHQNAFV